eukprot:comp22192_c0_seq1/m.32610 comp22192_c0_seq1/g.32610  ORF comp22192_c0_seq1/g.32610 comp22192_c0_seq1/m.32610 type:complete len:732 (-) comp22192_c0_seq1:353-2548(-)
MFGGQHLSRTQVAIAVPVALSYLIYPRHPFAPLHAVRMVLLRVLLKYKGWMTSPNSMLSKVFFMLVKALTYGTDNSTTVLQSALPRLPLPSLSDTCKKLIVSLQPLLSEEDLERTKKDMELLQARVGRKLQRYLWLHRWNPFTSNWLSEMWLRVAYLRVRDPLPLSTSYFCSDGRPLHHDPPTQNQTERVATLIIAALRIQKEIDDGTLKPMRGGGVLPVCMYGYELILGTTRLPGKEEDVIVQSKRCQHVAVACNGNIYRLQVIGKSGKTFTKAQLQDQVQQIIDWETKGSANQSAKNARTVRNVGALTTLPRAEWADKREKIIRSSDTNASHISTIESSLFLLALHTGPTPNSPTQYAHDGLHNMANDRWYDKSININVYNDGVNAINVEHSFCDGVVTGHWWEEVLVDEGTMYAYRWKIMNEEWTKRGLASKPPLFEALANQQPTDDAQPPELLHWDDPNGEIQTWVNEAEKGFVAQREEFGYNLAIIKGIGKDTLKKCRVSPDGFVQAAMHLAFYRLRGYLPLTYQPVSMHQYRFGRTETNRSMSNESKAFVVAMGTQANTPRTPEEVKNLVNLLKTSCLAHQARIRDAMLGQAIDRHLVGLRVIAAMTQTDTGEIFNGPAFTLPWDLITTSTPLLFRPENSFMIGTFANTYATTGGGFVTVTPGGFGCGYFFYDDAMALQISAKKGGSLSIPVEEAAQAFERELRQALEEMLALFGVAKSVETNSA